MLSISPIIKPPGQRLNFDLWDADAAVRETKERTQAAVDAAVREARGGDSGRRG